MRLARTICCLLTGFAAAQAGAVAAAPPGGGLADPTRPPFGAASAGRAEAPAGPQLQSVLISPGRKVAVINGRTVPLGGKFRGATLTRITESEVQLRRGRRLEVLKLFPRVAKKPLAHDGSGRRD
jgi:MSHA biogenesis protein MshK